MDSVHPLFEFQKFLSSRTQGHLHKVDFHDSNTHPGLSVKVATALDVISTLVAGQIGYAFSVPAYHPLILTYAIGVTYALFRWKDEITCELLKIAAPLQNRNRYNYYDKIMVQNLKFKMKTLKSALQGKGAKEKQKEIHLLWATGS